VGSLIERLAGLAFSLSLQVAERFVKKMDLEGLCLKVSYSVRFSPPYTLFLSVTARVTLSRTAGLFLLEILSTKSGPRGIVAYTLVLTARLFSFLIFTNRQHALIPLLFPPWCASLVFA